MTIERFDIPTRGKTNLRGLFEAFREYAKKTIEAKGEEMNPKWYPEKHPGTVGSSSRHSEGIRHRVAEALVRGLTASTHDLLVALGDSLGGTENTDPCNSGSP